jgi:hypothetical protein
MDVRDSQVVCVRREGSESRLGARRDPAHIACSRHPIIAPCHRHSSRFSFTLSSGDIIKYRYCIFRSPRSIISSKLLQTEV